MTDFDFDPPTARTLPLRGRERKRGSRCRAARAAGVLGLLGMLFAAGAITGALLSRGGERSLTTRSERIRIITVTDTVATRTITVP